MIGEWFSVVRLRCRALLHRRQLERDLEEELKFHRATRAERNRESGTPDAAASNNALVSFGNPTRWKEICRDMWTFYWIETLWQDLRYAFRSLRKSPGFAIVAAATLALGIGANTAIFSVMNAVILRPLPYPDSSRLVELFGNVKRAQVERRGASFADYADWRDQSTSFDSMAMYMDDSLSLTGVDEPERVRTEWVAHPYFSMLGVTTILGRTFRSDEDEVPMRNAVAVLGAGLWQRRFGGNPDVVGRSIQLNGRAYTVIGVMPQWFQGITDSAELWLPLHMAGTAEDFANRGGRGPTVLARLKRGISLAAAQTEMTTICKRLEHQYPATNEGRGVELSPLEREIFGSDIRKSLVVILVAVGFVLMIACTNVANLLLARCEARQKELAVRISLGAGAGRMLRQLTTESLLLAFIGAAVGIFLAHFGVRALMAASPITFPSYVHPALDPQVAIFTVLITTLAGLALGIAPAFQVRSGNLADAFRKASSHSADSRSGSRFRNLLVVAEVAFAMLLLVGAGLFIRSMRELTAINPGYDPNHVLTLQVTLPRLAPAVANTASTSSASVSDRRVALTAREITRQVAQIPSVQSVGLGSDMPLGGSNAVFYTAEGQPPVNAQNMPRAYFHRCNPDFFKALRISFVDGRAFTENELQGDTGAAIVSESLAKRFWPGQSAVGKRIKIGIATSTAPWVNIVGVVREMKYRGLPMNPTADPDIFYPFLERQRTFALLVRTPLDPVSVAPSVRAVLRQTDPSTIVFGVSSMQELIAGETARSRFTGWLMAIFAGAALLLAVIGIYGVIAYSVSRRRQEIGIRIALGASRADVLKMVVARGMTLIAIGLILGVSASLGLTRLIGTLLYGVQPYDILSFVAAAVVLMIVALLACLLPATRASGIAPAVALRNE